MLLAASTAPGMTFSLTAASNVDSIEDIVETGDSILVFDETLVVGAYCLHT